MTRTENREEFTYFIDITVKKKNEDRSFTVEREDVFIDTRRSQLRWTYTSGSRYPTDHGFLYLGKRDFD